LFALNPQCHHHEPLNKVPPSCTCVLLQ
jgi:hypothetical protein